MEKSNFDLVRVERIELSSRAPKTRSLPLTDTHICTTRPAYGSMVLF